MNFFFYIFRYFDILYLFSFLLFVPFLFPFFFLTRKKVYLGLGVRGGKTRRNETWDLGSLTPVSELWRKKKRDGAGLDWRTVVTVTVTDCDCDCDGDSDGDVEG